jgi:HopA1 effector protein family
MSATNLTEVFNEILTGLVIQPDFTISHPQHPDFTVAKMVADRLQASTPEIQNKFLVQHLQSYLMGTYFSQVYREPTDRPQDFANDESLFLSQIQAANKGGGYYDWNWQIESIAEDQQIVVMKDGLRLYMPSNCIHAPNGVFSPGELVAIAMPKNIMTIDRYVAIGNYGRLPESPTINIYWNYSPAAAIEVISELTAGLNQLGLPFELQIEPNINAYHRLEPLILSILSSDYPKAEPLLHQIRTAHPTREGVPPFAHKLASGLALTETDSPKIDFAAQCCRSIAMAIVNCQDTQIVIQVAAIERALLEDGFIDADTSWITAHNDYVKWRSPVSQQQQNSI